MTASHAMKQASNDLLVDFKRYLERQKLSSATIRYYLSDVRVFIRFAYQTTGQHNIFPEIFESYENFLKAGSLPTKTINRKLSSLRIFNTFLLQAGVMKENFMVNVRNNKAKTMRSGFPLPSNFIFLGIFFVIVACGGIVLAFSNKDLFLSASQSLSPTSVALSKPFTNVNYQTTYLNRNQNLNDIIVEGTTNSTQTIYGADVIAKGELSVTIKNTAEWNRGIVMVTPTSPFKGTYYVETQKNGFILHLSEMQETDFSFNWIQVFSQLPVDKLPQ